MTSFRTVPQIAEFANLPASTVRNAMDRSSAVRVERVGRVRVIATEDVPTLLNAPSAGAYSLLRWAKRSPDKFYQLVVTKVLSARGPSEAQLREEEALIDRMEWAEIERKVKDMIEEATREADAAV